MHNQNLMQQQQNKQKLENIEQKQNLSDDDDEYDDQYYQLKEIEQIIQESDEEEDKKIEQDLIEIFGINEKQLQEYNEEIQSEEQEIQEKNLKYHDEQDINLKKTESFIEYEQKLGDIKNDPNYQEMEKKLFQIYQKENLEEFQEEIQQIRDQQSKYSQEKEELLQKELYELQEELDKEKELLNSVQKSNQKKLFKESKKIKKSIIKDKKIQEKCNKQEQMILQNLEKIQNQNQQQPFDLFFQLPQNVLLDTEYQEIKKFMKNETINLKKFKILKLPKQPIQMQNKASDYQLNALAFILMKERVDDNNIKKLSQFFEKNFDIIHYDFEQLKNSDFNSQIYYKPNQNLADTITLKKPMLIEKQQQKGGILGDQMGLGKTYEALLAVMGNPSKQQNIIYKHVNQEKITSKQKENQEKYSKKKQNKLQFMQDIRQTFKNVFQNNLNQQRNNLDNNDQNQNQKKMEWGQNVENQNNWGIEEVQNFQSQNQWGIQQIDQINSQIDEEVQDTKFQKHNEQQNLNNNKQGQNQQLGQNENENQIKSDEDEDEWEDVNEDECEEECEQDDLECEQDDLECKEDDLKCQEDEEMEDNFIDFEQIKLLKRIEQFINNNNLDNNSDHIKIGQLNDQQYSDVWDLLENIQKILQFEDADEDFQRDINKTILQIYSIINSTQQEIFIYNQILDILKQKKEIFKEQYQFVRKLKYNYLITLYKEIKELKIFQDYFQEQEFNESIIENAINFRNQIFLQSIQFEVEQEQNYDINKEIALICESSQDIDEVDFKNEGENQLIQQQLKQEEDSQENEIQICKKQTQQEKNIISKKSPNQQEEILQNKDKNIFEIQENKLQDNIIKNGMEMEIEEVKHKIENKEIKEKGEEQNGYNIDEQLLQLDEQNIGGNLIIIDGQISYQWEQQLQVHVKKEYIKSINLVNQLTMAVKKKREKLKSLQIGQYDIVFILPTQLKSLIDIFKKYKWHRVIVDEAHRMPQVFYRNLNQLNTKYKWLISGTVMEAKFEKQQLMLETFGLVPWNNNDVFKQLKKDRAQNKILQKLFQYLMIRREQNNIKRFPINQKIIQLTEKKIQNKNVQFLEEEKQIYLNLYKNFQEKKQGIIKKTFKFKMELSKLKLACDHPSLVTNVPRLITNRYTQVKKLLLHMYKQNSSQEIEGDIQEEIFAHQEDYLLNNFINDIMEENDIQQIKTYDKKCLNDIIQDNNLECSICCDTYDSYNYLTCFHYMCQICYDSWFKKSKDCPTCTQEIQKEKVYKIKIKEQLNKVHTNIKNGGKLNQIIKEIKGKINGKETKDDKIIVFYSSRAFLPILREKIQEELKIQTLDFEKAINSKGQQKIIQEFNENPDKKVLLASINSINFGLDLQIANHIIMATAHYDPVIERQAEGRVHRFGQKKKVTVTKLYMQFQMKDDEGKSKEISIEQKFKQISESIAKEIKNQKLQNRKSNRAKGIFTEEQFKNF